MSYEINVLNPSLSVEGKLRNIKSVEIYEVINNQYVADVEITENTFPPFLHHSNLLEIDNDYFLIADIDKQRDSSKSINLSLEHISYKLNNPSLAPSVPLDEEGNEIDEFYEGSVEQVIQQLWGGMSQFTIQTNVAGYFYYRPKTSGGRSRIQEFARQNGLEVEYNKFTIFVHGRRGGNNGLELRVGENVRSVSQKISVNDEFYIEYAHEVDIVDFSEMSGQYHAAIASANIGDTVRIIDTDLAIDATERIVAKRYSPLFKQVPQISVGQVVRDIVDIINEDEEEKDKEKDKAADYFLQTWQIGDVNCLELSSVELGEEDVLPEGISSTINYYIQGEKKKMTLTVKSQYSNYHVYIGEWYEDNTYIEYKLQDVVNVMASWEFPKPKMQAISVTVCEVPLEEYDAAVHKLRDYGVKFNKVYIDPLKQFKVGNKNILAMNTLIDIGDEVLELEDFSAKIDYNLMQELTGVTISLRREFSNYKITIITMGSEGIPTVYDYDAIKEQLPTWKLPRADAEYLLVSITEVPTDQFNPAIHKRVMYGVKFEYIPIEPLREFKVGENDCLYLTDVKFDEEPTLEQYKAEVFYNELNEHKGLKIALKREFASYHVRIKLIKKDGVIEDYDFESIKDYIGEWTLPESEGMHLLITAQEKPPSEFDPLQHRRTYYAVKFTKDEAPPEPEETWLSEFMIGNVDCLLLPGVNVGFDSPPENAPAKIEFTNSTEHTGLFLSIKPEYANYHVMVMMFNENDVDIVSWESIKDTAHTMNFPNGLKTLGVAILEVPLDDFNPDVHKGQFLAVGFVASDEPTPGGNEKFRNLRTKHTWASFDDTEGAYIGFLNIEHKDFDYYGHALVPVFGEVLTGALHLQLENFSGGLVEFDVALSEFGDWGRNHHSVTTTLTLPSGTFSIPVHYSFAEEEGTHARSSLVRNADESVYRVLASARLSGTVDNVEFSEGSLWGVVKYLVEILV